MRCEKFRSPQLFADSSLGLTQNPHPDPLPQGEGVKLPSLWGGLRGGFAFLRKSYSQIIVDSYVK